MKKERKKERRKKKINESGHKRTNPADVQGDSDAQMRYEYKDEDVKCEQSMYEEKGEDTLM